MLWIFDRFEIRLRCIEEPSLLVFSSQKAKDIELSFYAYLKYGHSLF